MTSMTPEAKRQLSTAIRGLRERLLADLHAATDSAYRLSAQVQHAGLSEAARARRARLEAWIREQVRAQPGDKKHARSAEDFRRDAEKQAAYTLLNRLVVLRLMEARELRRPAVVTGGWDSRGYADFRSLAPALARRAPDLPAAEQDDSEGFEFLLKLVFEDLALDLPGIFGPAGVADLIPVPAATLRHVIETLDEPELASCWHDDMTLGWVYQYWNDPEREALDAKLHARGKVEPHEIASKTQMFTERYMVDWLLQNSLGPMWLAMCKKHGWTPACEADGILDALEARRADWRARRDAGEVTLTELMPLHTDMERRWAYYVPQPIPDRAVEQAPASVRDLKILDPAVGSGHFLVVAFDLLFALYQEEAAHRGEQDHERWSNAAIVARILEHNLHGIDLDPRAVQIAAAALWLKAKSTCAEAAPQRLNLVASDLRLVSLPDDDPGLVELRREVERETGIPGALTDRIVEALRGADHLGSLLKIDAAVDEAIRAHEAALRTPGDLFDPAPALPELVPAEAARAGILARLEHFLARHGSADDLGLRLRGEQLARGIRFLRMLQEGRYDLVVGNPPYQGTSKMADASYVQERYERGKADLYAAFLQRGLELVQPGGVSALLTMRNWMFLKQYAELRQWLLETHDLRALGDFAVGAFDEVPNDVLSVAVSVFCRASPLTETSTAQQPTPADDHSYDRERTPRKRAATLCHVGRYAFDPAMLKVVPEWPLVYWWSREELDAYQSYPLIGQANVVARGVKSGNDPRFLRLWFEVAPHKLPSASAGCQPQRPWQFYIKGAAGTEWIEPASQAITWKTFALELNVYGMYCAPETVRLRDSKLYFRRGVAFSPTGSSFSARVHHYPSIFGDKGSSVFSDDLASTVCAMNSRRAREIVRSLNPSISFQVGDVNRLPLFPIADADAIYATIEHAFTEHESHRESSVESCRPGPSPWRYAQEWAQAAVDRPEGAPLPPYEPAYDPEPPTDHVSFALGVALGRFGAGGEGILDPAEIGPDDALPAGILFLDGTLDENDRRDSLGHPRSQPLHDAWAAHGADIDAKSDVRTYLRLRFFADVHRQMYESRPIHWPLSSEKRTFVAWINIHRWDERTLRALLAEHLHPALARLEGQITDLRAARDGADKKAARAAERRYDTVLKWRAELADFIEKVTECAEKGPPKSDGKCPPREVDARYAPDLDDGVMINSAALWPLLDPQWKDPKKWWKELATSKGRKDYDWSHLAMRYWPTRVDAKCQEDPSLGVAHGCFWRYHPARAWAWELRLQDEIGPDFRIEEAPYDPPGLKSGPTGDPGHAAHRAAYLRDHAAEALAAIEKEALRRRGRGKDADVVPALRILEPGLWTALPEECWEMELRIIDKQGADFRLLAPDEPEARVAFETKHPEKLRTRQRILASLMPPPGLFEEDNQVAGEDDNALSNAEDGEEGMT